MADLLFTLPPAANGDLLFGDGAVAPDVDASITGSFAPLSVSLLIGELHYAEITGTFSPLTAAVTLIRGEEVAITGNFPPLVAMVEAQYTSNTQRPTVGKTSHPWQIAEETDTGVGIAQQGAAPHPDGWETFWQRAMGAQQNVEALKPDVLKRSPQERVGRFQDAVRAHDAVHFKHQDGDRSVRRMLNDAFETAALLRNSTHFRHQDGDRTKRSSRSNPWQVAKGNFTVGHTGDFQSAVPLIKGWQGRYQEGVPPPPGLTIYDPGTEPPFSCYTPNPHILFSFPFIANSPHLIFQCGNYAPPVEPPDGEVVVPVKKVYIVANNTYLRRVSDNALVPVLNMNLTLDVDSWTWGFNATLPGQAQALVEPDTGPIELKANINGTEFRVIAENLSRERVFGQSTIRVSGRGRNAFLDAPYAAIQTFANSESRTAQQLMNDVLTLNGIPLGWTIDWQLEDWSVPGGVFNHQGSYISALVEIAKSAGGYLLPHASNQSFAVKHLYPQVPWEWATVTPNFTLPADVTVRESLQWRERPEYNRVYVSGQGQGILGQVTRAGTAGDILAPMVVDSLITDTIAARQRGKAVLGNTGRQINVGLRLPVLEETGVIRPGHFVDYVDGGEHRIGLVRGVSVEVGMPEVWQTLEVETHA